MLRNPLDEAGRVLRLLSDRLRAGAGPEGEWLADRIDRLGRELPADRRPEATLEELQAELEGLIGLESVKEQVSALVAFLQVQVELREDRARSREPLRLQRLAQQLFAGRELLLERVRGRPDLEAASGRHFAELLGN